MLWRCMVPSLVTKSSEPFSIALPLQSLHGTLFSRCACGLKISRSIMKTVPNRSKRSIEEKRNEWDAEEEGRRIMMMTLGYLAVVSDDALGPDSDGREDEC